VNFELIENGPSTMTVRARCDALGVTEQGFYAFRARRSAPSARAAEDAALSDAIAVAHEVGRQNYGTPRLKDELATKGFFTSRRRIGRLRSSLGLQVRTRRAFVCTTQADPALAVSPNLLDRAFVAQAPNSVWVSDITYLTAGDQWLYLCTIIDCYSGAIVARQLSRAIDAQLVRDTLSMALRTRKPTMGCLFHSDRGSQYASADFRKDLAAHGFTQSMSRRANCWDNAVAESSFARFKTELGDTFEDEYEARRAIYEYIDVFYNMIRIHSRHHMAPLKFELACTQH
jgi:transposase InsO family protein